VFKKKNKNKKKNFGKMEMMLFRGTQERITLDYWHFHQVFILANSVHHTIFQNTLTLFKLFIGIIIIIADKKNVAQSKN